MRRYANVSYSPWANPFPSSVGPGKPLSPAAPEAPSQPLYRRIITPNPPTFYYPGIVQLDNESESEDEQDAGQAGAPVMSGALPTEETPVEAPMPPAPEVPPVPEVPEPSEVPEPPPPVEDAPPPPPPPPPTPPAPAETTTEEAPPAGDEQPKQSDSSAAPPPPEPTESEVAPAAPENIDEVETPESLPPPGIDEAEQEVTSKKLAEDAQSSGLADEGSTSVVEETPEGNPPETTQAPSEETNLPADDFDLEPIEPAAPTSVIDGDQGGVALEDSSNEAVSPPPPPPAEEHTDTPKPVESGSSEASAAEVEETPVIDESPPPPPEPAPKEDEPVVQASEPEAQAAKESINVQAEVDNEPSPKQEVSHEEKTVHFPTDLKDPKPSQIGHKKKEKGGSKSNSNKPKLRGFMRPHIEPPPPAPSPPSPKASKKKEKVKPAEKEKVPEKEKPVEKESARSPSPIIAKRKIPSRKEERKSKKEEKTPKGKKSGKGKEKPEEKLDASDTKAADEPIPNEDTSINAESVDSMNSQSEPAPAGPEDDTKSADVQEAPEAPEVPEAPKAPEMPAASEAPETLAAPETTEAPEAPEPPEPPESTPETVDSSEPVPSQASEPENPPTEPSITEAPNDDIAEATNDDQVPANDDAVNDPPPDHVLAEGNIPTDSGPAKEEDTPSQEISEGSLGKDEVAAAEVQILSEASPAQTDSGASNKSGEHENSAGAGDEPQAELDTNMSERSCSTEGLPLTAESVKEQSLEEQDSKAQIPVTQEDVPESIEAAQPKEPEMEVSAAPPVLSDLGEESESKSVDREPSVDEGVGESVAPSSEPVEPAQSEEGIAARTEPPAAAEETSIDQEEVKEELSQPDATKEQVVRQEANEVSNEGDAVAPQIEDPEASSTPATEAQPPEDNIDQDSGSPVEIHVDANDKSGNGESGPVVEAEEHSEQQGQELEDENSTEVPNQSVVISSDPATGSEKITIESTPDEEQEPTASPEPEANPPGQESEVAQGESPNDTELGAVNEGEKHEVKDIEKTSEDVETKVIEERQEGNNIDVLAQDGHDPKTVKDNAPDGEGEKATSDSIAPPEDVPKTVEESTESNEILDKGTATLVESQHDGSDATETPPSNEQAIAASLSKAPESPKSAKAANDTDQEILELNSAPDHILTEPPNELSIEAEVSESSTAIPNSSDEQKPVEMPEGDEPKATISEEITDTEGIEQSPPQEQQSEFTELSTTENEMQNAAPIESEEPPSTDTKEESAAEGDKATEESQDDGGPCKEAAAVGSTSSPPNDSTLSAKEDQAELSPENVDEPNPDGNSSFDAVASNPEPTDEVKEPENVQAAPLEDAVPTESELVEEDKPTELEVNEAIIKLATEADGESRNEEDQNDITPSEESNALPAEEEKADERELDGETAADDKPGVEAKPENEKVEAENGNDTVPAQIPEEAKDGDSTTAEALQATDPPEVGTEPTQLTSIEPSGGDPGPPRERASVISSKDKIEGKDGNVEPETKDPSTTEVEAPTPEAKISDPAPASETSETLEAPDADNEGPSIEQEGTVAEANPQDEEKEAEPPFSAVEPATKSNQPTQDTLTAEDPVNAAVSKEDDPAQNTNNGLSESEKAPEVSKDEQVDLIISEAEQPNVEDHLEPDIQAEAPTPEAPKVEDTSVQDEIEEPTPELVTEENKSEGPVVEILSPEPSVSEEVRTEEPTATQLPTTEATTFEESQTKEQVTQVVEESNAECAAEASKESDPDPKSSNSESEIVEQAVGDTMAEVSREAEQEPEPEPEPSTAEEPILQDQENCDNSEQPKVEAPAIEEPVSQPINEEMKDAEQEPKPEQPTIDEPVPTEQHHSDDSEPAKVEAPTIEEPTDQPIAEDMKEPEQVPEQEPEQEPEPERSSIEQPVPKVQETCDISEQPVVEAPAVEEAGSEQPILDESAVEQLDVAEPTAEEPSAGATSEEPNAIQEAMEPQEPGTKVPVVEEPAAEVSKPEEIPEKLPDPPTEVLLTAETSKPQESQAPASDPPAEEPAQHKNRDPETPPNESAVIDEPTVSPSSPPKEKRSRRHSQSHDSKHRPRTRRRESDASSKTPVATGGFSLFAAAKAVGAPPRSKRRDSMTSRDSGVKVKEISREVPRDKENGRSKDKDKSSHRTRNKEVDKEARRRALEAAEEEAEERRRKREVRRAEEKAARKEEAARQKQIEEEERKREEERRRRHEERRAARKAEEERIRREEEERRIRREESKRHQAEKARQLQFEEEDGARREEEERHHRRREKRRLERERENQKPAAAPRSIEKAVERPITRDAARRAAEEESEIAPASPVRRSAVRRSTGLSDRARDPSPSQHRTRRNSLLGGLAIFGRSKTEPVAPSISKTLKPTVRVKTDPVTPPSPPAALRGKDKPPSSKNSGSGGSMERTERPRHGHRRHSSSHHNHHHRTFKSAEEEAEYRANKEERRAARAAKDREVEMSGGRDGGISLANPTETLTPAQVDPEPAPLVSDSVPVEEPRPSEVPIISDSAAVVGEPAKTSTERRRASRKMSAAERPRSSRTESDRHYHRPKNGVAERSQMMRSEAERRSSTKRKDEVARSKGFWGGFKKLVA